ncbi:hypothetical protein GDO81_008209 [Engystomops pustulosus]|uniref:Interferon/interleukin receptor domain-containing protein n=1 Tax=Engystomops pustulosus TaxID=76066 RepID=A0AAV7CEW2_ENGPU|nr:hypothetical protein GDO81_008209 [Engystomops pustulosus]
MLYGIKYANTNYQKKVSFIIRIFASSKLIKTENTEETKWNITNLAPGNYCISVSMMFGEITSLPSPNKCVEIKGIIIDKVYMGSILAVVASVVIVALLAFYLVLYRDVLHPKTPLPSNLILHINKLNPCDYVSDADVVVPPLFEGMDFSEHILAFDKNFNKHPKVKRYVSTEIRRKDYVNCRQKGVNESIPGKMLLLFSEAWGLHTGIHPLKFLCSNTA